MKSENEILEALLNVHWLRPETALWRAVDISVMKDFIFESPSLDMGCGDGIFSFIRAGGKFDYQFDMFQSVATLDKFFEKVDVYDHFDANKVNPVINEYPKYKIDVALDHKQNLLNKASTLGLYNKFVCHDANKDLPFNDNSFKTIFSNVIYWLDSPVNTLTEIRRILMPDGQVVMMLPNETLLEYSFYYRLFQKTQDPNWAWLENIDRGRVSDNIKHAYNAEKWESIFKQAGLNVVEHKMHLSKTIIEIWDIGLRPLFPVLHKMSEKLNTEDRVEIKKEWIDLLYKFTEPLCRANWVTDNEYPPAFHYYVLKK